MFSGFVIGERCIHSDLLFVLGFMHSFKDGRIWLNVSHGLLKAFPVLSIQSCGTCKELLKTYNALSKEVR